MIKLKTANLTFKKEAWTYHFLDQVEPGEPITEGKVNQIFRFSTTKNFHQIVKERPCTFRQLSLNSEDIETRLKVLLNKKTIIGIKYLKNLKSLNLSFLLLLSAYKRRKRFLESLKHLKNLSHLHFSADTEESILVTTGYKYYQNFFKIPRFPPNLEIRLSLFISLFTKKEKFIQLLNVFNKSDHFISAHLTFGSFYWDNSMLEIQQYITLFKTSKSLSKLEITISMCNLQDLSALQNIKRKRKLLKAEYRE